MKADDDTFVCVRRVLQRMHDLPRHIQPKVYAGITTTCGMPQLPGVGRVIKDPNDRW
jgi:hypothetical protein